MSADPTRLNLAALRVSVAVAATLVALKLWALWATGALSIAGAMADSALDLFVSLGALAALAYAARPPDEDHAFGHSSAEDLAALAQGLFIVAAGVALGAAAVLRLTSGAPHLLVAEGAGIAAMAVSTAITLGLVIFQSRIVARTGNRVVSADRLHYLGDLVPNLGAMVALWASARFGLWQIDGIVAVAAGAILIGGGLRIGRGAVHALMDRGAPEDIVVGIGRIADGWPGVRGWHDLKTRTAGSVVFVNLHIELDGDQTLAEAHEIGARLRRAIIERYPQADVIIHKDVARVTDPYRDSAALHPGRAGVSSTRH
jgi:ferrous-iron efflux pump FieF